MRKNPINNSFKLTFVYYKYYISIELTFLKELMLIKQANQKSVTFFAVGDIRRCWWHSSLLVFLNKGFKFEADACNGCHDLLMLSINLSNIAVLNIEGANYHCIISGISKNETINLMQNIDLIEKSKTF